NQGERCSPSDSADNMLHSPRISSEDAPSRILIRAGNIHLKTAYPFNIAQCLRHKNIFADTVTKKINNHGYVKPPQKREFFLYKCPYPYVLQTDCIKHPCGCFDDTRHWVAFTRSQ